MDMSVAASFPEQSLEALHFFHEDRVTHMDHKRSLINALYE